MRFIRLIGYVFGYRWAWARKPKPEVQAQTVVAQEPAVPPKAEKASEPVAVEAEPVAAPLAVVAASDDEMEAEGEDYAVLQPGHHLPNAGSPHSWVLIEGTGKRIFVPHLKFAADEIQAIGNSLRLKVKWVRGKNPKGKPRREATSLQVQP